MIKSKPTEEFPAIEWELGPLLEKDIDERMEVFEALGSDKEGNQYEAEAYYYGNELEEIKNILKL